MLQLSLIVQSKSPEYAIPKIKVLCNLHCLKVNLRLLCNKYQQHNSLNLVSQQLKLCDIFIFGMAYLACKIFSVNFRMVYLTQFSSEFNCLVKIQVIRLTDNIQTKGSLKIKQTAFIVLLIKRRYFFGAPSSQFLKPRPNRQTLFLKHLKLCLLSTTFVGLSTKQTRA